MFFKKIITKENFLEVYQNTLKTKKIFLPKINTINKLGPYSYTEGKWTGLSNSSLNIKKISGTNIFLQNNLIDDCDIVINDLYINSLYTEKIKDSNINKISVNSSIFSQNLNALHVYVKSWIDNPIIRNVDSFSETLDQEYLYKIKSSIEDNGFLNKKNYSFVFSPITRCSFNYQYPVISGYFDGITPHFDTDINVNFYSKFHISYFDWGAKDSLKTGNYTLYKLPIKTNYFIKNIENWKKFTITLNYLVVDYGNPANSCFYSLDGKNWILLKETKILYFEKEQYIYFKLTPYINQLSEQTYINRDSPNYSTEKSILQAGNEEKTSSSIFIENNAVFFIHISDQKWN